MTTKFTKNDRKAARDFTADLMEDENSRSYADVNGTRHYAETRYTKSHRGVARGLIVAAIVAAAAGGGCALGYCHPWDTTATAGTQYSQAQTTATTGNQSQDQNNTDDQANDQNQNTDDQAQDQDQNTDDQAQDQDQNTDDQANDQDQTTDDQAQDQDQYTDDQATEDQYLYDYNNMLTRIDQLQDVYNNGLNVYSPNDLRAMAGELDTMSDSLRAMADDPQCPIEDCNEQADRAADLSAALTNAANNINTPDQSLPANYAA